MRKSIFDSHCLYKNISATSVLIRLMFELLLSAQGEWIYLNFTGLLFSRPSKVRPVCHMAADQRCHSVIIKIRGDGRN